MADIRIEKKEKSGSILPWLLGLGIAALAIWGILEAFDEGEELIVENEVEEVSAVDRGAEIIEEEPATYTLVDFEDEELGGMFNEYALDYETFTANMEGDMGLGHEFSHEALTKLANTVAALATAHDLGADADVMEHKQMIKSEADRIMTDPMAGTHADNIRDAAMAITGIMERVQEEAYPGFEGAVAEVRTAAEDISSEDLTLDQKEDVKDFFGSARVAIKAMREQPATM